MDNNNGDTAELDRYCRQALVDMAAARIGGKTLACSDDFFAEMANLLKPGRGVFIADKYTDRGKWMDGWESRRSYGRDNGRDHDFCIIKLGLAGIIRAVDVDTNHFRGNAPLSVSIEAAHCSNNVDMNDIHWTEILANTEVGAHQQNLFAVDSPKVWTHIRFNIYPDGGVARLRVYGDPVVDLSADRPDKTLDLAAITNGARALLCSDMFFSDKNNLIMPGKGLNMGDGWETRRRRDPGPDWIIIKLAAYGQIDEVLIDTAHFKGNYPDHFSLEATVASDDEVLKDHCQWHKLITGEKLFADQEQHFFPDNKTPATHVRLNIYPDGGLSRLRLFGRLKAEDHDAS